jgi:ubiquitin-conjugating enzyme E2 D
LQSRRNGDTSFDRAAFQERMKSLKQLDTVKVAPMSRGVVQAAKPVVVTATPVSTYTSLTSKNMASLKASSAISSAVMKRFMKELNDMSSNPLPNMFIYPGISANGEVCDVLKVLMVGLQDHPMYKDYGFELSIRIPSDYPFRPPQLQCVTPIYHYAISADGRVCLPILHDNWSPAKTIRHVLEDFSDLVHDHKKLDPDCNYAIRSWLSDLLRTDSEAYTTAAIRHTKENAKPIPKSKDANGGYTSEELFSVLA